MTIHTDRPTTASPASRRRRADDGDDRADGTAVAADDSIPQAAVRRVLDSDRRRELLRCLLDAEETLELPALVARIADAEHDATAVTSLLELRQRVHVSLCRTHLPLLENYRVLAYDEGCGCVAPGARLSAFESVLDLEALSNSDRA
ncbi:hypothetical protein [Haloterrigena salinisoli]|uniref:DUF7344 domain-containing protein n=1 Tax=Haloterrigena salinisoli TaxID=3132747 RepID=UPI0030D302E3